MNREVKCKAWDRKQKIMIKPDGIEFRVGGINVFDVAAGDGWAYLNEGFENLEQRYDLVWWTELEDVDGVEIYGGHVVEQSFTEFGSTERIFDNPPDDLTSFIGEVKMYDGSWWIDSGSWAIPLFSELNPNKVIGNRFANPELLEG